MFKKLLVLSLVFIGAITLSACTPKDQGPTTEEILTMISEALDELELPATTSTNLTLPNSGLHEVTITWASSNTAVIANDGTVTVPTKTEGDKNVTMTATLALEGQTLIKTFTVKVLAATTYTDAELVAQAVASLVLAVSGIVTGDITLPATGANGTAITWASSNTDVVANDGTVTRPANGDGNASVTLTATLTLNAATGTKEIDIIVAEEDPSNIFATVVELNTSTLGDVVEFEGVVTATFDGGYFLTDGTNAIGVYNPGSTLDIVVGNTVYVKGEYAKYNTLFQIGSVQEEEITAVGDGTQPLVPTVLTVAELLALDSSNPLIHGMFYTISGTLETRGDFGNIYVVDGDDAVLVYYYSNEDSLAALEAEIGKVVTITVFYYTNHGTNGVMVAFDGLAADIDVFTLSDADALAADIAAVGTNVPSVAVETVTLPTEGPNGTLFTNWVSDNTAVYGNDGTFVARGAETVTVTFTATATKGTETGTATIEVLVPVASTVAEVLAMANNSYFEVTGTVYTISYYGVFIWDGSDYIFVYNSTIKNEVAVGDDLTILGKLGEYNGLKQVNIISYENAVGGNTNGVPTAMAGTIEGLVNDMYPMGAFVTVTGLVSIEGSYNDLMIAGVTGEKIKVYYRSNASELTSFAGQVITLTVVPYNTGGTVLFQGVAADATVVAGYVATDLEKAQAVADQLDLGVLTGVAANLTLPVDFTDPAATITWATSDAGVVTNAGVITFAYGSEATATLTATVTVGTESVTRDFVVTLVDGDSLVALSVADALLETDGATILVTGVVAGFNYKGEVFLQDADGTAIFLDTNLEASLAIGDLIVVVGQIGTYTSNSNNQREMNNVSIVEVTSQGNAVFVRTDVNAATLGVLATIDTYSSQTFTMDLTVNSLNDGFGYVLFNGDGTTLIKIYGGDCPECALLLNVGDTQSFTFSVFDINYDSVRLDNVTINLSDADALLAAQEFLTLPATIENGIDLPLTFDKYNATITWSSATPATISDAGVVVRPAYGEADVDVVLTATITVGSETAVTKVFTVTVKAMAPDLFFSEYGEPNGNNCKFIEIYNPTDGPVNLASYHVARGANSKTWAEDGSIVDLTGTIASGGTVVIYRTECLDPADDAQVYGNPAFAVGTEGIWIGLTGNDFASWNGDDSIGLFKDGYLIDMFGDNGAPDPGTGWPVGNGNLTDGITANSKLIRIPSVVYGSTDWAVGAQQWIVYADVSDVADEARNYSTVGVHTSDLPAVIADPITVTNIWDAAYSAVNTDFTDVYVTGIVAGLTDKGYILQDPVTAEMISVHDAVNMPAVGDEITISGQYNVSYEYARILNVTGYIVDSSGNSVNLDVTNAVDIDWATFDATAVQGVLVKVTGAFWAKLYDGATSYVRLSNDEAGTGSQNFDNNYIGLQNGANELNLTGVLADYFTATAGTAAEYSNLTVYLFFYDSTSSYNKAVIIDDSFIIDSTPAS